MGVEEGYRLAIRVSFESLRHVVESVATEA